MATELTKERREKILAFVKIDLGMINAYKYDERLLAIIDESVLEIEQEGANLAEENAKTDGLIISLAAWHWRTRDTMAAMPRAIRWNLNNLIFSQKARTGGES